MVAGATANDLVNDPAAGDLVVVILAGGAGTRFWPASTSARPKQLLSLVGDRSLLQQAVDRVRPLVVPERVFVITGADLEDAVVAQLPELPRDNIVAEPMRRDTAAAVALMTGIVRARFGADVVVAVLTADHVIGDGFAACLVSAVRGAKDTGAITTFGVVPTRPATGYGYLEVGAVDRDDGGVRHCELVRFVEKPPLAFAERFLAEYQSAGRYLWNSGMFVFPASTMAAELERSLPEHAAAFLGDDVLALVADRARLQAVFAALPRVSIDKGVMEKALRMRCVHAAFSWSDVGSFVSLAEHLPQVQQNAVRGRTSALDASGNVVWCDDKSELVALVGVTDLVVVRAGNRTLVAHKDRAEDVKKLVELLGPEEQ